MSTGVPLAVTWMPTPALPPLDEVDELDELELAPLEEVDEVDELELAPLEVDEVDELELAPLEELDEVAPPLPVVCPLPPSPPLLPPHAASDSETKIPGTRRLHLIIRPP